MQNQLHYIDRETCKNSIKQLFYFVWLCVWYFFFFHIIVDWFVLFFIWMLLVCSAVLFVLSAKWNRRELGREREKIGVFLRSFTLQYKVLKKRRIKRNEKNFKAWHIKRYKQFIQNDSDTHTQQRRSNKAPSIATCKNRYIHIYQIKVFLSLDLSGTCIRTTMYVCMDVLRAHNS